MSGPLSLDRLWRETLADTRALMPLALPVAAALVLLPNVLIERYGPPLQPVAAVPSSTNASPAANAAEGRSAIARPAQSLPLPRATPRLAERLTPRVLLINLLLPSLIGLFAQAAIIRLALDRRAGVSRSVGEALVAAIRLWPLIVVVVFASALPIGFGLLALVVPGLYLAGRLTLAVPLVVEGVAPVAALERAWALSAGNGWRIIGFTLLIAGWFFLISAVAGAVGAGAVALLHGVPGVGPIVASVLDGLVAALFTVVNAVAVATVYRLLR